MSRRMHRELLRIAIWFVSLAFLLFHVAAGNAGAETYRFLLKWGSNGTGDGQFDFTHRVAVGPSGDVYVVDFGNHRIQRFDSDGTFIRKWGTEGSGDGQFNLPRGIAIDPAGNVYVADTSNNRIQKFDSSGVYIRQWGTEGEADGQFKQPFAVAVDSSANVYVAEDGNRIQKFDSDGNFIRKWGSVGSGDGQFNAPRGVAVDTAGNVYVSEYTNHRIQKFDSDGNFIRKWGSFGSGDGQFDMPYGLAADSSGHVFVADHGNGRVQKFDSDGNFIVKWGSTGPGDGQFSFLTGVAVDALDNVYVADMYNYRIQKFYLSLCTPPPSGLIAWWAGDDNAQDMQETNPGTLMNGASFADGKVGRAFSFDGADDYIDAGADPIFNFGTQDFTIDFWVKFNDLAGEQVMIEKAEGSGGVGWYFTKHSSNQLIFGGAGCISANCVHTTDISLSSGNWVHLAITRSGDVFTIYLNGTVVAANTDAGGNFSTANPLLIGRRNPGGQSFFTNGLIDELAIFNRALSASEIAVIYNSGSGGICKPCAVPPSGMAAWWKGEGNAFDAAGTYHGTLNGTVGYAPGKVGQAFSFDGMGWFAEMPAGIADFGSSAFTVTFWMYPANDTYWHYILGKSHPNGGLGWDIRLSQDSYLQVVGVNGWGTNITSADPISRGFWHHVVLSSTPTAVELFVNGVLKGSSARSAVSSTANPFRLGYTTDIMGSSFNGLIDEVQIFNRALSSTEIGALYDSGCAGACFIPDTMPTPAISVNDQSGLTPGSQGSTTFVVSGINVPTSISVTGNATLGINGVCVPGVTLATVLNGDTVTVCLNAPSALGTPDSTSIAVGAGAPVIFTVTTRDPILTVEGGSTSTTTGTVSGAGIADCQISSDGRTAPSQCANSLSLNTPVTLNLSPAAVFATWSGCDSSTEKSCNITITSDITITAVLARYEIYLFGGGTFHHKVHAAFSAVDAAVTVALIEGLFDESLTDGATYSAVPAITVRGGHGPRMTWDTETMHYSMISPSLTLSGGPVLIENIVIQ